MTRQGAFIWYELLTSDIGASRDFYGQVMGWSISAEPVGDMDYRLIAAPDGAVAGAMPITPEMAAGGARPVWLGYLAVDDVDAVAAAIKEEGAQILIPPTDIPRVGRFAMVTDPQGAAFYIMRPIPPAGREDAQSDSFAPDRPGHVAWNELTTSDPRAALDFYNRHFGFEAGDAMPMGEMGEYRFIHHGGERIGAITPCQPGGPPPMWGFYWRVEEIDGASQRAHAGGASVLHGPAEVPDGDYITITTDPQGAMFAMVGKRD